ncbi:hypothetical protein VTH8203_03066 [Vibrio thalassae]|uniref:Uncharacterized protein n=1 Tax=Vibrio thalassae TaxID=1243014 RepID=A0A240EMM7_9VIBR|nr:hypothetical protein [Vibrio thalassae]SNX49419.1 hypothetical protein VTH8203_03066 [Vibrio thalassae]
MRTVIEFTQSGRYMDRAWEGEIIAEKGVQKAVSPSLAMRLVSMGSAIAIFGPDGKPLTVDDDEEFTPEVKK